VYTLKQKFKKASCSLTALFIENRPSHCIFSNHLTLTMKKTLLFIACLVAMVGYRVITPNTAHAQSMTPAQTAALEQSLADAKASLIQLEMQEGIVPPAEPGTPSVMPAPEVTFPATATPTTVTPTTVAPVQASGLSAQDVVALKGALGELQSALALVSSQLETNPQLTANDVAVVNALQGIGNTLALIGQSATGQSTVAPSAPVAVNTPSPVVTNPAPVAAGTTPSAPVAVNVPMPPVPTPSVTLPAPAANPTVSPTQTQTAQASSFWSFTEAHWPTITIVLLIILILAILLWPGSEETSRVAPVKIQNNQPSAPRVAVSTPVAPMTPTPMSNVVSTSAPGSVEFQQTKVTVVRPPEQKKKTA
jgi:hypothetical protein